jgi:hypothetical protein
MYGSGAVDDNIKSALQMAEAVWNAGMMPFVPHLFMFWNFRYEHTEDEWLALDKAWLLKCDVLLVRGGVSPGTRKEMVWADEVQIPWVGVRNDLTDLDGAVADAKAICSQPPKTAEEMAVKQLAHTVATEVVTALPDRLDGQMARVETAVQLGLMKE